MTFTQSDLANKYKINRSTISRWISSGKLASNEFGGVEESDFLMVFRQSSAWKRLRESATAETIHQITGSLPLNEPNQLTGDLGEIPNMASTPAKGFAGESDFDDADNDLSDINLNIMGKPALDRMKLIEEVRERQRKNGLASGQLIKRPVVRRFAGKLGEIDSNQWGTYTSRVIDDVMSLAGISDNAVKIKITERLDDEIYTILQNTKTAQLEFIESMRSE